MARSARPCGKRGLRTRAYDHCSYYCNATTAKGDGAHIFAPPSSKGGLLHKRLRWIPPPHIDLRNSACTIQPTPVRPARRTPTVVPGRGSSKEPTIPSDSIVIREELVFFVVSSVQVREVDLVSQQAANATKPFDELSTLLRAVRYKL